MKLNLSQKFVFLSLPVALVIASGVFAVPVALAADGPNLIANPSLETGTSIPDGWAKGNWGTNTTTFTYPVAGAIDTKAAKIDISGYSNGDAKWYFNNVPVTAGTQYHFKDQYISTTPTTLTIRYSNSTGAFTYLDLATLPASAAWATADKTFTVPTGMVSVTIFHIINSNGSLTVDDFSLATLDVAPPPAQPTVTLSANPTTVTSGSSTTLTWSTTNATTCTASSGWSGVKAITGSESTGNLTTNSTFTLTCTGPGGSANQSVIVTITTPPPPGDTQAPTVPTGLAATAVSPSQINLTWNVSTDNTGVTGYNILRCLGASCTPVQTTTSATNSYNDMGLAAASLYRYTVSAFDAVPNTSAQTAVVSVTTQTPPPPTDTEAPTIPANLVATPVSTSQINLSWNVSTDNTAVTGYKVFRCLGASCTPVQINTTATNSYPDSGLAASTIYRYTVAAFDAANNVSAQTAAVSATTQSVPPPPPPVDPSNLIQNPSLETDADANNIPDQWSKGNWGTNTTTFTYPVTGVVGAKAGKITVSGYTDGDAKWFFNDVSVTAGKTYKFKDQYLATANTSLTIRYTNSTGGFTYVGLGGTLTPSAQWQTVEQVLTIPTGIVSLTVFHIIAGNGSLTVDNFSFNEDAPLPPAVFNQGFVSLDFDDGWRSHFDAAKPILDTAGIKGTFYIISNETARTIANPSLETDADNNNIPDKWTTSKSGTSTTTFAYPVAGVVGTKAAKITVSSYKSGESKWTFNEITALPDESYAFHSQYTSTVSTKLVALIRKTNGSTQTVQLGTFAASSIWKSIDITFYVPVNAKSVTVYQTISANGSLTTDDYSLRPVSYPYINQDEVLALQSAGHEIGDHTRTHPDLTTLTTAQATTEISGARTDLISMGATPVNGIAYPYGAFNSSVQQIAKNAGLTSGRSVNEGYNTKSTDKFGLLVKNVLVTTTVDDVKGWINQANTDKTWLILVFHQIDHSGDQYGTTPEILQGIVDYIKSTNTITRTVTQGVGLMNP